MLVEGLAKLTPPKGIHIGRRLWKAETNMVVIDPRYVDNIMDRLVGRNRRGICQPLPPIVTFNVEAKDLPECRICGGIENPAFDLIINSRGSERSARLIFSNVFLHILECYLPTGWGKDKKGQPYPTKREMGFRPRSFQEAKSRAGGVMLAEIQFRATNPYQIIYYS